MKTSNKLHSAIRGFRMKLGLSARELSCEIGRSPQFIAGIERIGQATFETLKSLIDYFGNHPALIKNGENTSSVALTLISAVGIEIPVVVLIDQKHGSESNLEADDEVLIVGNQVSEEAAREFIELRTQNLLRGVTYSFFLATGDCVWEDSVKHLVLKHGLDETQREQIRKHLRIFQTCELACLEDYKLVYSRNNNPQVYQNSARTWKGVYLFPDSDCLKEIPIDESDVHRLMRLFKSMVLDLKQGLEINPKNGYLKQLYPKVN